MAPAHTHTQRLHPSLLCPPSAGVATHTGSSKIFPPSTIQNQHQHPSRRKDLSCQHGLPVALPSTLKHGIVHALIFLVLSQPFASHIPRWADVHKSTPQKATVITQALAMSVCVCMDPLLTRAGRQPAAGALVPVRRLQHGEEKMANSSCTYSHRQCQHAGRQPSLLSTSRNAEKRRGIISQQCHNPRTHVGSTREDTQITNNTLHMSSEHHSDTPRYAKQKYSSPQRTSSRNHIVHAPRTAAHTRSNKCSSDQCYRRAAVGSKQKTRAAKPECRDWSKFNVTQPPK
ncbi:hypothetical protein ECC02_011729 [Trypanosoma cruzi]|uniref:Uncharacterized protein n=1 Tax=Trypanosoma cruzi TaxID=5693 RepID=A0A7J6XM49_TRYCR|nr:hypothetical protein ECC02_011729 [Trypanosoma cruzi]